jgi:HEPN domain-containing protein
MSQRHSGDRAASNNSDHHALNDYDDLVNQDNIERLLVEGVHLDQPIVSPAPLNATSEDDETNEDDQALAGGDVQGAIGLFAEAAQDLATAGVELGLGRHFACVDFCNQSAEKAAQSVSLLRFGRRTAYNHDLRKLGAAVGAPLTIQDDLDALSPFHPEQFYADTPPEEADEIIDAEQASAYQQTARRVLRWARSIVLTA